MTEIHVFSDELNRTLSFFDMRTGFEETAAQESRVGAKHAKAKLFIVSGTEHRLPLLCTKAVEMLAIRLDVDERRVLDVSNIAPRTFQRRQEKDEPLSATETDRVLRIARVARQANDVFVDEAKARRWLSKSNRMLGGTPLEMLATDAGAHEVEAELHRINFGDFA